MKWSSQSRAWHCDHKDQLSWSMWLQALTIAIMMKGQWTLPMLINFNCDLMGLIIRMNSYVIIIFSFTISACIFSNSNLNMESWSSNWRNNCCNCWQLLVDYMELCWGWLIFYLACNFCWFPFFGFLFDHSKDSFVLAI